MDLLRVRVTENDPHSPQLTLHVTAIHPDENTFCIAKQFVIMLLEHADEAGVTDTTVARPDADEWEEAGNAWYDYVSSVDIVSTTNFPRPQPPEELSEDDACDWRDDHRPQAVYRITFVDPSWSVQLPVGASWGSTAYDELNTGEFFELT